MNGRRARFQRIRDARFFGGWILESSATQVSLRSIEASQLDVQDRCRIEIYSEAETHSAVVVVLASEDTRVVLRVEDSFSSRPSTEVARLIVASCPGSLMIEGLGLSVDLHDVSVEGCGVLVDRSLKRGSLGKLAVDSPHGRIDAEVEVRYCRPDAEQFGMYRAGLRIRQIGRIEKARLQKLAGA